MGMERRPYIEANTGKLTLAQRRERARLVEGDTRRVRASTPRATVTARDRRDLTEIVRRLQVLEGHELSPARVKELVGRVAAGTYRPPSRAGEPQQPKLTIAQARIIAEAYANQTRRKRKGAS